MPHCQPLPPIAQNSGLISWHSDRGWMRLRLELAYRRVKIVSLGHSPILFMHRIVQNKAHGQLGWHNSFVFIALSGIVYGTLVHQIPG
jgi:hypothetical protein